MTNTISHHSNAPMHFIIVDDNEINNFVSMHTIRKHNKNADIQLFTDPELALVYIKDPANHHGEDHKTIIFLDINMPIMDGWQFLDAFANNQQDIAHQFRIYMFSSSIDPAEIERAKNHPFVSGFFSKPLRFSDLDSF